MCYTILGFGCTGTITPAQTAKISDVFLAGGVYILFYRRNSHNADSGSKTGNHEEVRRS